MTIHSEKDLKHLGHMHEFITIEDKEPTFRITEKKVEPEETPGETERRLNISEGSLETPYAKIGKVQAK